MVLTVLLLVVGFVLLIKGADLLNDGATAIARRFGVSDLLIGLTIVAMGTSLPELFVTTIAGVRDSPDLAVGNILGSNIANILLILGFCATLTPLVVQRTTIRRELPFSILAVLVLALQVNDVLFNRTADNSISRGDGFVLLCFFAAFLYYVFSIARKHRREREANAPPGIGPVAATLRIVLGLVGLLAGGMWIVDGAVVLATAFGVSEKTIGLTIVAVGTSLPELAASGMAAYRNNTDIAVGNVVGSNIFNIFWILGISAVIQPIPIRTDITVDLAVTLLATLLLMSLVFTTGNYTIRRLYGVLFLLLYCGYIVRTFLAA